MKNDIIERAISLENSGQTESAIDIIRQEINELLKLGMFTEVDSIFMLIDISKLSPDIIYSLIVATKPAHKNLLHRKSFVDMAKQEFNLRNISYNLS
jgi:hypothetical protein